MKPAPDAYELRKSGQPLDVAGGRAAASPRQFRIDDGAIRRPWSRSARWMASGGRSG